MKTTTTSVRIRLDQAVEVEKRDMNISKFLREKLDDEFGSNDFMKEREKELKKELKNIKNLKKIDKKNKVDEIESYKEEKEFLIDAKKRLKQDPTFIQGIFKQYKNIFGKRITIDKFSELMNEKEKTR